MKVGSGSSGKRTRFNENVSGAAKEGSVLTAANHYSCVESGQGPLRSECFQSRCTVAALDAKNGVS